MALKKRKFKMAITAMAIVSLLVSSAGVNNNKVYADSTVNMDTVSTASVTVPDTKPETGDKVEQNVIPNVITYLKNGESSRSGVTKLRDSLSRDTLIEVEDNKTYMTLEFTQSQYSMIENVVIKVDGKENTFEKSADRKYKVEIKEDLTSEIVLKYDVVIPIAGMPPHTFDVGVSLDKTNTAPEIKVNKDKISLNVGDEFNPENYIDGIVTAIDKEDGDLTEYITASSTIKTTDGKIEEEGNYELKYSVYDINGETTNKSIDIEVSEKQEEVETDKEEVETDKEEVETDKEEVETDNNETTLNDGKYTINNTTVYSGNSSVGTSMVRNSLKEVSYIEVKDGELYVTLEFNKETYSTMENLKITVNGSTVKSNINGCKYTFKVNSIDSVIGISANITAMNGMSINYTVALKESTIEKIESSTSGSTNENTSESTGGSTSGSTNENTSESTSGSTSGNTSSSDTTESVVKKGKLYTIKNTVDYKNQTGKDMARKYLNSTSKVEEVDGQKYVTLTFTGSDFMKNHVIYVNGSKVSHTVAAKSGDSISLRFKVSSVNDTIQVGMYVVPMSRDIKFTVKLLEDTLTFVKDYEVSTDGTTTLPQTGSVIDGKMAIGIGSGLMAIGTMLNRRKRK